MSKYTDYCLVLGSKPNSVMPDINPKYIYAANGAIERGMQYKAIYKNSYLFSICTTHQLKKKDVYDKVLRAKPDKVILRGHEPTIDVNIRSISKYETEFVSGKSQFQLDKHFFGIHTYYTFLIRKRSEKLKTLYNHYFGNYCLFGSSTGLWTLLYALKNNPNSKIVIAGIGLKEGGHFYGKGHFHNTTAKKDNYLAPKLEKNYKNKLLTTDIYLAEKLGIEYYQKS